MSRLPFCCYIESIYIVFSSEIGKKTPLVLLDHFLEKKEKKKLELKNALSWLF
ncbi:hypothetical protein [Aquibacillus rhizosphaerae]|uniref:Uncharacterized protein n=1 Tax=Aquibacillus rhizosphaerae TaxID=3051431 RepID=A0ABT7L8Q6_9BACI|nr:hypothetical protein [Aquibacillus sp. LR5S19]MDL4842247.1 hypothetical protein [Aquibacillus sp. LR5S19]